MINKKDALQIYIILFLMKLFTNNKTGEPNGFEKKYGKNLSLIIPISKTNDFHIHHSIQDQSQQIHLEKLFEHHAKYGQRRKEDQNIDVQK